MKARVLFITGGDDQMWSSAQYVDQMKEQLYRFDFKTQIEHLYYPKAGHCIGIPNMPQPGSIYYHPVGKKMVYCRRNRGRKSKSLFRFMGEID